MAKKAFLTKNNPPPPGWIDGAGAFGNKHEAGIFFYKRITDHIAVGAGFDISPAKVPNIWNWDFYMGRLPVKK